MVYAPSGKISAGMSVPVHITFSPIINEDINSFFPILAETGPINIPLICTYKKSVVTIENPIVNFNKVIFGEKAMKNLKLVNNGAMATEIRMKTRLGADVQRGESSMAASSMYGS